MKKSTILIDMIVAAGAAAMVVWPRPQQSWSPGLPAADVPLAVPPATVVLEDGDRFNLTASAVKKSFNGQEVEMLAYNGSIPGPLIRVKQGSAVTIIFTNQTAVATTVHAHGVRLDNRFDGVPDLTQPLVQPGQSFTYQIKFPDAGVYWYHPHFREDYAQELGLYGNFLVTPSDPNFWPPVNREAALVLDDVLVGPDGIEPFSSTIANRALMGRYGNTMLVNGQTEYRQEVQTGEVVRLFLTNVANARPLNVGIKQAPMKLVGGDNGRYLREQLVTQVLLNPSERAVVDVWFAAPGAYRLEHRTPDNTYALGEFVVSGEPVFPSYAREFSVLRTDTGLQQELTRLQAKMDGPADKRLRLGLQMQGMGMMQQQAGGHQMQMMGNGQLVRGDLTPGSAVHQIEWEDDLGMMNVMSNSEMVRWQLIDEATGATNMDINWDFAVGDIVKISVFNNPESQHPMQHPIHFHGNRFLVVSTNGVKNDNPGWKDTALVQTGDTVDLLVEMSNPGEWMAHCHIAEHLEAGMMMKFVVR